MKENFFIALSALGVIGLGYAFIYFVAVLGAVIHGLPLP